MYTGNLGNVLNILLAIGIILFWATDGSAEMTIFSMTVCILRLVLCVFEYGFEPVEE